MLGRVLGRCQEAFRSLEESERGDSRGERQQGPFPRTSGKILKSILRLTVEASERRPSGTVGRGGSAILDDLRPLDDLAGRK
ncbi:hypothetical protein AAFF_G00249080 [Aldrovandia affinis]|uniref:Uncharacterized protein n=1 Tax=Aldrovandia affinis TaxID=143900 RepID=A0AAD7W410_9TELE|nr:hypothetical protein AAFF_G00249080 [Aldrovandia affinis]